MPTTWLVSTTNGNDANGGTSQSVRSSGSDGVLTLGNNTFTSASANWSAADIGHGIKFGSTVGNSTYRKITAVGSATSLTYSGAASVAGGSSITWNVGGMWKTWAVALGTSA